MKRNLWYGLLVILAIALTMPVTAQNPEQKSPPAFELDNASGLTDQKPDMHGSQSFGMGPKMRPGMPSDGKSPRGPMSPEMQKQMNQRNSIMATAEAHKQLSQIYEKQGKIDDAAGELKKILALIESENIQGMDPKQQNQILRGKLIPVYHEIARLYLQNKRTSDAEAIINEGIKKLGDDDPAAVSRLLLHLGEIYKNSDQLDKAADNYKRIIEMNQKVLDQK